MVNKALNCKKFKWSYLRGKETIRCIDNRYLINLAKIIFEASEFVEGAAEISI